MTIDPGQDVPEQHPMPKAKGAMGTFTHDQLVTMQQETLSTPRRTYEVGARVLFGKQT